MSGSVALGGMAANEAIPREYHRRVLKKIAQLTKVVYALNTRNEEHESLIAALKSTYEARAIHEESSTVARLREMSERVENACEEAKKRVEEVKTRLEEEREQLMQKEVIQKKKTEELLNSVQQEHKQKMAGLVKELEQVSLKQAEQLKEIAHLRDEAKTTMEQKERELTDKHRRDMRESEQKWRNEIDEYCLEAASVKTELEKEVVKLKEKHRCELESLRLSLEEERGVVESQKWEERERILQEQMKLKEQSLAERVSGLSDELRTTRDQLVVYRHKVNEVTEQLKNAQSDMCEELQCQLEEAHKEKDRLVNKLTSLQASLGTAEEDGRMLREQLSEKEEAISGLKASHTETVAGLKTQLMTLQERIQDLVREKETLAIQHHSTIQKQSDSLSSVEMELLRLRKEKDELHLQYAREIEAAHAQIGDRETELSTQHISYIKQMKQKHETALLELRTEHEKSCDQLRCVLTSESDCEKQSLYIKHQDEMMKLRDELTEKDVCLTKLRTELTYALTAVDESGRGLGAVESDVERLKGEIKVMTEKERDDKREIEQLKELVERLKNEMIKCSDRHNKDLEQLRSQVHKDTQAKCNEIMRCELEALRQKMSATHAQSIQQALKTLALQKDAAMSEARRNWEREESSLKHKVLHLEQRLEELQHTSSVSLKEGRKQAEKQITDLRDALECEKEASASHVTDLEKMYHDKMEKLMMEEREKKRMEIKQLNERWSREIEQREMRYCEEMKKEGEIEKIEAVNRVQETHRNEIDRLQHALEEQHGLELRKLQNEQERERDDWERVKQLLESQKIKEVSEYRRQLDEMKEISEKRLQELTHTRDSLTSITEEAVKLRKELEVRSKELMAAKRQAANVLRCREQELSSRHHAEVESMTSQYRQQTQLLLSDFNKAKKIMSSKTSQLQRQLLELESLYESREPRPEDVQRIRELEGEVKHYQTKLKKTEMEKKIYELELVNREKNYNQIFSSNPCVGVLDPLASSKKKPPATESSSSRHSSAPSLITERSKLPALVNSTSRLTASDVELGGWSSSSRPRPQPTQSPLTRRTRDTVY